MYDPFRDPCRSRWASLVARTVKSLPAMQETPVPSPGCQCKQYQLDLGDCLKVAYSLRSAFLPFIKWD